jgi:hypothetical protein
MLTRDLGLLIVLAVVGLLLPFCDSKPGKHDPLILDADEADDSVLI